MIKPAEITALRKKLHMTLSEFGEKLGKSAVTIYYWEKGLRKPRYDSLERIQELEDDLYKLTGRNGCS